MGLIIKHNNMKPTQCPKCQSDWDGGSILETFIKQRDEGDLFWEGMTDAEIEAYMKETYSPPYRWQKCTWVNVYYPPYNGKSFLKCPDCNAYFDPDSMAEVKIDDNFK